MLSKDEINRLFDIQDCNNQFEDLIQQFYVGVIGVGNVVVDGGAHCAMHTLPMAKLVGETGRVLAFEPVPSIANYLRTLVKDFAQVSVYEAALSDHDGERPFYEIADAPWLSSAMPRTLGGTHQENALTVKHVRLDQFAGMPIRFIKLDLEGGEYHALRGGEALLKKQRPIIVLESGRLDSARAYGYTKNDFFELFQKHGYELIDLFGSPFSQSQFDLPYDTHETPHYLVAAPSNTEGLASILLRNAVEAAKN